MKPSDQAIATAFREYHGGPAFEAATRRIEDRAAEIQRDLDAQPQPAEITEQAKMDSEWAKVTKAWGRILGGSVQGDGAQPSEWPEADVVINVNRGWEHDWTSTSMPNGTLPNGEHPLYTRPTVERLLAERDAEIARLRKACSAENDEICQTLGKALGCPWFKDHQDVFPGATEADGVCVGDHVAASLAAEAAKAVESLRAQLAGRVADAHDYEYRHLSLPGSDGQRVWSPWQRFGREIQIRLAAPEPAQAKENGNEY